MSGIDLGTIRASIVFDTSGMTKGITAAGSALGQFEKQTNSRLNLLAQQMGRTMTLAGAGIAGGLALATKKAAEFDQSMRNTNSLLKLNEKGFQDLKKGVLGVVDDPKIRQGPADLAKAMYDIASSGFQGQKALDILRQSAYGASAGMTDTATSSRVLMAVLNSGISGVNNAREAMDVLFKSVDLGVFSFEQLANALGDVLPTAKIAGVSLQELGAALAAMTRRGINVNESVTALNQMLNHIIKPGKEAKKVFDELHISYGLVGLQAHGLTGILQQMSEKTEGQKQKLVELMPEIRAMKAVLSLTDEQGRQYTEMLKGMQSATSGQGATQAALNEQNKGAAAQYELLKKEVEKLGVEIGTRLLPVLRDVLTEVKTAVEWFDKLPSGVKDSTVKIALFGGAALLAAGRIAKLVEALKGLGLLTGAQAAGAGGAASGGSGLIGSLGLGAGALAFDQMFPPVTHNRRPSQAYLNRAGKMGASFGSILPNIIGTSMPADLARQLAASQAAKGHPAPSSAFIHPFDPIAGAKAAKDARDKALEAAKNRREAEIELLRLTEGAAARRMAAEKAAQDEYVNSINDGTRTEAEAFAIRKAKYARAQKEYLDAVNEWKAKLAARKPGSSEIEANAREITEGIKLNAGGILSEYDTAKATADIQAMVDRRAFIAKQTELFSSFGENFAQSLSDSIHVALASTPMTTGSVVEDVDAIIKKGEDAIEYARIDVTLAKKMEKGVNTTKELLKGMQRDFSNIFANLFEDVMSGGKNPFQSFLNAFKQMLIRMAAELAASEVMKGLSGLFGGGKGNMKSFWDGGKGAKVGGMLGGTIGTIFGGPVGGAIGGALGGILGFDRGGWVPGPVGAPQPAVVHGGEFVVSRAMLAAAGGGGGVSVNITGPVHIRSEADITRLAERIDYQSRVRRGSGR